MEIQTMLLQGMIKTTVGKSSLSHQHFTPPPIPFQITIIKRQIPSNFEIYHVTITLILFRHWGTGIAGI
jgi:hypothetical protein